MLSASSIPFIQASVPVLRERGETISRRFYANLFAAHPELENVFNMGNQASGLQQRSLATALLAYAANFDRPDLLAPVIDRIAHKHASLGITPAQYTIVGRHLLGALKAELGDAATPALLSAWDEAYWLLAGTLIAAEARLYALANVSAGEFRELTVREVKRESALISSFVLQNAAGEAPGAFVPGQFVSVAVKLAGGLRQLRQYSLSDAPSRPYWRITVKREPEQPDTPAGRVSNHLHTAIKAGDTLSVGPAFGNFVPAFDGARPLALLSGGVGISPLISVLNTLAEQRAERRILFAHAARDRSHYALRGDVQRAQAALPNLTQLSFFESDAQAEPADGTYAGRMQLTPELIAPFQDADFYVCGPLGFMREQFRALSALGVPPERMHREVFGPELIDELL